MWLTVKGKKWMTKQATATGSCIPPCWSFTIKWAYILISTGKNSDPKTA
jgi:hypothetical protein